MAATMFTVTQTACTVGGDSFVITDQEGRDVYQVKGQAYSVVDRMSFQDMAGKELAFIQLSKPETDQDHPAQYEIIRNGELWGGIRADAISGKKEMMLDIPGPNDYRLQGHMMDWNFKITRSVGDLVATIDKKLRLKDTYSVKIERGEDVVAILLATIVVDQVYHDACGGAHEGHDHVDKMG
jgi:uncharacterized protein YxjI